MNTISISLTLSRFLTSLPHNALFLSFFIKSQIINLPPLNPSSATQVHHALTDLIQWRHGCFWLAVVKSTARGNRPGQWASTGTPRATVVHSSERRVVDQSTARAAVIQSTAAIVQGTMFHLTQYLRSARVDSDLLLYFSSVLKLVG